ncbi:hypothetical protein F4823DRAFT_565235 [Ustulina deusta]|nr:hypothetical protein F4823DRAFT_565235 [Ustulina deusta]
MRPYQLVAFCLSAATFSAADPASNGITVVNHGAFDAYVYVRGSRGHESKRNGPVHGAGYTHFDHGDLTGKGFQEGESCWMVVDVSGGIHGHESGDNFDFRQGSFIGSYSLTGGTLNPSWHRLF